MNEDVDRSKNLLKETLKEEEHIVWAGRPNPGRMLSLDATTVFTGAFGFLISTPIFGSMIANKPGFNFGNGAFSLTNGSTWLLALFLALSVLFLCRPLLNQQKAKRTLYAITSQRVFIITENGPKAPIKAPIQPRDIDGLELIKSRN